MVNSPEVEVPSSGLNKLKLVTAALFLFCAVIVFYWLDKQNLWVRVGALMTLLAISVLTVFTSDQGKQLLGFGKDSIKEAKKVVWPSRKEAGQMTLYVFVFVFLMALFLFVTDKTLEWVLYDLILGWKR
jgi:preprotein translocase subunit SecE